MELVFALKLLFEWCSNCNSCDAQLKETNWLIIEHVESNWNVAKMWNDFNYNGYENNLTILFEMLWRKTVVWNDFWFDLKGKGRTCAVQFWDGTGCTRRKSVTIECNCNPAWRELCSCQQVIRISLNYNHNFLCVLDEFSWKQSLQSCTITQIFASSDQRSDRTNYRFKQCPAQSVWSLWKAENHERHFKYFGWWKWISAHCIPYGWQRNCAHHLRGLVKTTAPIDLFKYSAHQLIHIF